MQTFPETLVTQLSKFPPKSFCKYNLCFHGIRKHENTEASGSWGYSLRAVSDEKLNPFRDSKIC